MARDEVPKWGADLTATVARLSGTTDRLKEDVSELRRDVTAIKTAVDQAHGGLKISKFWLSLGAAAILALAGYAGAAYVESVAQRVVDKAATNRRTIVQYGVLSVGTAVSRQPPTFEWALREHVDPARLVDIRTETDEHIPGIAIKSELAEGGTKCRMTVISEATATLPSEIRAQVIITIR